MYRGIQNESPFAFFWNLLFTIQFFFFQAYFTKLLWRYGTNLSFSPTHENRILTGYSELISKLAYRVTFQSMLYLQFLVPGVLFWMFYLLLEDNNPGANNNWVAAYVFSD